MNTIRNDCPLFSVIMPVYNGALYIEETIRSVLRQTQKDLELLVIDDGSTDETSEIVQRVSTQDNRVKLHFQMNSGVSAARNHGLKIACGYFVTTIDADDLWPADRIESQYHLLQEDDDRIVIGGVRRFSLNELGEQVWGSETKLKQNSYIGREYVEYLLTIPANNMAIFNTACGKKSLIAKYGGWDQSLVSAEDWEHWLRLAQYVHFHHLDKTLLHYRKYHGSVTSRTDKSTPLRCHLRIITKVAYRLPLTYWQRRKFSTYRFKEAAQALLYNGEHLNLFKILLWGLLSSNLFLDREFYRITLKGLISMALSPSGIPAKS